MKTLFHTCIVSHRDTLVLGIKYLNICWHVFIQISSSNYLVPIPVLQNLPSISCTAMNFPVQIMLQNWHSDEDDNNKALPECKTICKLQTRQTVGNFLQDWLQTHFLHDHATLLHRVCLPILVWEMKPVVIPYQMMTINSLQHQKLRTLSAGHPLRQKASIKAMSHSQVQDFSSGCCCKIWSKDHKGVDKWCQLMSIIITR